MGWFDELLGRARARGSRTGVAAARDHTAAPLGFSVIALSVNGLDPQRHAINEVAVVTVSPAGQVMAQWSSPVRVAVSPDLAAQPPSGPSGGPAPTFADLIPQLNARLAGTVVVAHHLAPELAWLRAHYRAAGWTLPHLVTLSTVVASEYYQPALDRRRLLDCATAAGIPVLPGGGAVHEALATADLLGYYLHPARGYSPRRAELRLLGDAAEVVWPTGPEGDPIPAMTPPAASPHVGGAAMGLVGADDDARREQALAHLLDAFCLDDARDEDAPDGALAYLERLVEALEDGELTGDPVAALSALGAAYALSDVEREAAHRALVLGLCHLALDDGRVTRAERGALTGLAELLDLPASVVGRALERAESARAERNAAGVKALPADWLFAEPLRVGDRVVFTGPPSAEVTHLKRRAAQLGVRVLDAMSRKVALHVSDQQTDAAADEAEAYGVATVTPAQFALLLDYLQPARHRTAPTATAAPPVAVPPVTDGSFAAAS